MTIKRIDKERFVTLREEWNLLLLNSGQNSVFLTWEWIFNWWEVFGKGKELFLLEIREAGLLVAIAPFYIEEPMHLGFSKVLRICSVEDLCADYGDLICRRGYEKSVLQIIANYLMKNLKPNVFMEFSYVKEDSLIVLLVSMLRERYLSNKCFAGSAPQVNINSSFDDYMTKKFGRKRRYNFKREESILLSGEGIQYEVINASDQILRNMGFLFNVHDLRAREINRKSAFTCPEVMKFHLKFAQDAFEKNLIDLRIIRKGQNPIAATYSFRYLNKMHYFQSGFDPVYAKYGVGNLMIMMLIRYCHENNYDGFDFLRGDESYKDSWATSRMDLLSLRLYPRNIKGYCAIYGYHLKKGIIGLCDKWSRVNRK